MGWNNYPAPTMHQPDADAAFDQLLVTLCQALGITPAKADAVALATARATVEAQIHADGGPDAKRAIDFSHIAEAAGDLYLAAEWAGAASVFTDDAALDQTYQERAMDLYTRAVRATEEKRRAVAGARDQ